MEKQLRMTPEEILEVEKILKLLSDHAHKSLSLLMLIEAWMKFVSQVEHGYDDSIYEYTNDLSIRDLLQRILDNSSLSLRGKLLEVIQVGDNQFKKSTSEVDHPLTRRSRDPLFWWWFRIPLAPGTELAQDLRVEGYLK